MELIHELISEFGVALGLPQLTLDENNCCTLQFDDVMVNMEYLPDTNEFYFYSRIGSIPADGEDRLRVFAELLESNCFYRRTSGGVLGIDASQNTIIYTNKTSSKGLDAITFCNYMEAFINLAEEFSKELQKKSSEKISARGDEMPPVQGIRV